MLGAGTNAVPIAEQRMRYLLGLVPESASSEAVTE